MITLDAETARQLGWETVRLRLAALAQTPQGKERCLSLVPLADAQAILVAQQRGRQLKHLVDQGHSPPLEEIDPIEESLARAGKGGGLTHAAVLSCGRAMQVSSRVRSYLMQPAAGEALVDMARGSHDLLDAGTDLVTAFDEQGELRDSASPVLRRLRQTVRGLAEHIRRRLEAMLHDHRLAASFQEAYITERADRYVLPVRSDSRSDVQGIVHDTSQSGATLFIEPVALVEDGNRLKIAITAVVDEERKILAEFSREIAEQTPAIQDNLRLLAEADLTLAAVRLGQRLAGDWVPVSGSAFDLRQARHPLLVLEGQEVVANDIRLADGRLALVITGPNAGGKTVALKTLGLACLMTQAGLPIAAASDSSIGLFGRIHAVIGDSQDIGRGLSTFSAHIDTIARILHTAAPGTLVLLDELAADTDPAYGAALACAIVERLAARGTVSVTTTHYEALKQLPYRNPLIANSSVGFDLSRMEPTFRLHPDRPGRSLTLDIARRIGMPDDVLQHAADLVEPSSLEMERVLKDLEREQKALTDLRSELEDKLMQVGEEAQRHRQATQALTQAQQEVRKRGKEALLKDIASARREVAELIESLRSKTAERDMKQAVAASQRLIALEADLDRNDDRTASRPAPFEPKTETHPAPRPGDRVLVLRLGTEGQVLNLDARHAMVTLQLGSMTTRVPVEQVQVVGRAANAPKTRPATTGQAVFHADERVRTSDNSLDLRGHRVDEAVDQLDRFLDALFGRSEPTAFIIHGHGTGALRAAVREYLAGSPYPRHFRSGTPEEGGDGVTVVALK